MNKNLATRGCYAGNAGGRARTGTRRPTSRFWPLADGRGAEACDLADGRGVLQVGGDRGDDDAGLDRHEIDAHERQPHPGVDDDALVENAIEHVDDVAGA